MSASTQVYPIRFDGVLVEQIPNDNNIINQGVVELAFTSGELARGKAKQSIYQPPLSTFVTSRTFIANETTTVTPSIASSYEVQTPVVPEGFGFFTSNVIDFKHGLNERGVATQRIIEARDMVRNNTQTNLKLCLDGAFGTSGALRSTHYTQDNLSINSGIFDLKTYQEFLSSVMGEYATTGLTTVIVNSKTYDQLLRSRIIANPQGSEFNSNNLGNILGKNVIVNDTICATETISESDAEPIYVLGGQPFGVEYMRDLMVMEDFKADKGMGVYEYYMYNMQAPTIKGLHWTKSTIDAFTDLSTVANWEKKWQDKNYRLLKYMVRV